MLFDIVVIGSLNIDLVVRTLNMPVPGETIRGEDLRIIPGGKGANQAAAAAKMGASVAMVGKVGQDVFGSTFIRNLNDLGVNTNNVFSNPNASTGSAVIIVDQSGENCIVLSSGANGKLAKNDVVSVWNLLREAKVLLLQLEIPLEVIEFATELASEFPAQVILNAAPAQEIDQRVLNKVDFLVLNETEAGFYTGIQVNNISSAENASELLLSQGVPAVIVTLGKNGALLGTAEGVSHCPAPKVQVLDTTAAGDAFMGGLATALVNNLKLHEAVRFANCSGALAVTKFGAQTSLPTRKEVQQLFESPYV